MRLAGVAVERAYLVTWWWWCCCCCSAAGRQDADNNFGTVLYGPSDVAADRRWTDRESVALQCRMLVARLVPTRAPRDARAFLDYFRLIGNKTRAIGAAAGTRRRALVAVIDALGGYLYARMLPRARTLYYEGELSHSAAKRLHDLMNNIKYVLDTDGRGWARPEVPSSDERNHGVEATATAVAALVVGGPQPGATAGGAPRCGGVDAGPYGPRRPRRDGRASPAADDPLLPFFDYDTRPHSLVVPWRPGRPVLYNVRDAACHRALFDHCALSAKAAGAPPRDHATAADRYARDLSAWLHAAVRPLVTRAAAARRWYPGLWAALPVARLLHHETGPPTVVRDPPPAAPNVNFYAAALLASAAAVWTAGAVFVFCGCEKSAAAVTP